MRADLNNLLMSILVVLLTSSTAICCNADCVSDLKVMCSYMKDRQWDSALSQLKILVTKYPGEAGSYIIGDETKGLWGLKLQDAIVVLKQAADSSLKDNVGLKLRVALLDCYKDQAEWNKAFSLIETLKVDYPNQQCAYHYLKSICYHSQEEYDTALEEMRKAVSAYNGSQDEKTFLNHLLDCYPSDKEKMMVRVAYVFLRYGPSASTSKKAGFYRWAGLTYIKADRPVEATTAYKKSLELCDLPEGEKAFISQLLDCYSSGADKKEISIPGAVYSLLSDSPGSTDEKKAELYKHVGLVCLQQAHRPIEATTAFKKAVQLHNASGQGTGLNFIFSEIWIDGEKLLLELEKIDCKDADALSYCRAIAKYYQMYNYLDSKQYEKAIPVCKDIVASNTDAGLTFTALSVLAECLYPLGRVQEAYDFADKYYREHQGKQDTADYIRVNTAYWAEKDWQKVASLCEKFVETYPDSPLTEQARNLRTQALESSGNTEAAAESLKNKLKNASDGDKIKLIERLGNIYLNGKMHSEAIEYWEKLIVLPEVSSELKARAMYYAGYCYQQTGKREVAARFLQSIIDKYPDTAAAKNAKMLLGL